MKTSDLPDLPTYRKGTTVPETKQPDAPKAAPAKTAMAPAAESSDPLVHKLLADRQGHASVAYVEEDPSIAERKKAALAAISDIDEQLADLGFTAK